MIIKHQSAGEQLGWSEMSVTGVAEWARWSREAVKVTKETVDPRRMPCLVRTLHSWRVGMGKPVRRKARVSHELAGYLGFGMPRAVGGGGEGVQGLRSGRSIWGTCRGGDPGSLQLSWA